MTIEDNLKKLIDRKFGNVKYFAENIELPYTTVRSILQRGILNAKVENVIKIADGLGMKAEDLLAIDNKDLTASIETIYNQLNDENKAATYEFASNRLEEQLEEQNKVVEFKPKKLVNGRSTAAGEPIDGASEDGNASTMIVNQRDIPNGADEIVTICGDSMEPMYEEGSQVFIHWQPEVEQGEIALVSVEGFVTCKKVYMDWENDEVILRSINEAYEDQIYPIEDVRVIGKVL